jgi:hypothetical protein
MACPCCGSRCWVVRDFYGNYLDTVVRCNDRTRCKWEGRRREAEKAALDKHAEWAAVEAETRARRARYFMHGTH